MSGQLVVILLSTYDGARYVAEQVESLRRQTVSDWMLLVRDDGSSDETLQIVQQLAKTDRRIVVMQDGRGNLGPAASFGALLEQASNAGAEYVALCDQDDVWSPNKLARELDLLRRRECEVGEMVPLLVHSDLAVVREDLSMVHRSFLAYQGLRHLSEWPLGTLLIQNSVVGCTTVINRALLQAAVPLPTVIMHDWWLALCAAALGEVLYLPEATVLYRQHGRNAVGPRGRREAAFNSLRRPFAWWLRSGALLDRAIEQGRELTQRLEREGLQSAASPRSLVALREFCSAFGAGGSMARLRAVLRHRIRPRALFPYHVRFYVWVLLWSRRLQTAAAAHIPAPCAQVTRPN
jgi:glycosyltransferase involved in cell wall biosynthesis